MVEGRAASILAELDEQQRRAVVAPRGPLCILAGAGTGKTRTVTHRIAYLVANGHVRGDQVLAVTFSNRAAGELRSRLQQMGIAQAGTGAVQARTFHSTAMRTLAYFWPQVYGDRPWQLLDNKFRAVAQSLRRAGVDPSTEEIRDVLTEIDWAKSSLVEPLDYIARATETGRGIPLTGQEVARAYAAYEDLKTSGDVTYLDFSDLLTHMALLLEDVPAVAEEFRDRYRCFVVDEFQDVTPSQNRLLRAWMGRRDDLTVVGDANQTIYSFAGARPEYLLDFAEHHPGATLVRLESDYRSTPQVVSLANAVIAGGSDRFKAAGLTLRGMREEGPVPKLREFSDEDAEAAGVAAAVADLVHSGTAPEEIAVLFRVNAQSERIETALDDAGIGYRVRGGEGFFDRAEIRRGLGAIDRIAENTEPGGLVSPDEIIGAVRSVLEPLGLTAREPAGARARETWQGLSALAGLVEDLATQRPDADLHVVVAALRERAANRHAPDTGGVTLATLHASKGLEWDAVFLIGAHEGSIPISHAIKADTESVEEERRLLYVGITRAREHLQLSWALARNPGGRVGRKPSRFLDSVRPASTPRAVSGGPGGAGAAKNSRCRGCGDRLVGVEDRKRGLCDDCALDVDQDVFEALRSWRAGVAREAGRPPYLVFTDRSLTEVALKLPSTTRELGMVYGVGGDKLERFGPAVLQIVRGHTG